MTKIVRIDTDTRLSRVVTYNGIAFLSGVAASGRDQDIKGQTQQVLAKIDTFLENAGTDKKRLLTAQIWLEDIARDFGGMNEVWNAWTAPASAPARATAQCEMASPGILVEIVVTAALPEQA